MEHKNGTQSPDGPGAQAVAPPRAGARRVGALWAGARGARPRRVRRSLGTALVLLFAGILAGCPEASLLDELRNARTLPGQVTGLSTSSGFEKITLSWNDPEDPDLTAVSVQWNSGSRSVPAGTESVTVEGLENRREYSFTLRAVDASGNESEGSTISAFPAITLGTVASHQKVSDLEGGFTGTLAAEDSFGSALASLGDLDGDGVEDLVGGAYGDDAGNSNAGAVYVLFMNAAGTVGSHQKISAASDGDGFDGSLAAGALFGNAVFAPGDIDDDGVPDLVVGAPGEGTFGVVFVLFLNTDGTVKASKRITDDLNGLPAGSLSLGDEFGRSVGSPGDLNGDGVPELLVGAVLTDDGGPDRGAAWVLFLDSTGSVTGQRKISDTAGGFDGTLENDDRFGSAVAGIGDLDGDGVPDAVVGAAGDAGGGASRGALYLLLLNSDGTVRQQRKIPAEEAGLDSAAYDNARLGTSVASPGDLDGDGVADLLAGGAAYDSSRGGAWVIFLNEDGSPRQSQEISEGVGGFSGTLAGTPNADRFGYAVGSAGDLNDDGVIDLAVGAFEDDDGGPNRGAFYTLFLEQAP